MHRTRTRRTFWLHNCVGKGSSRRVEPQTRQIIPERHYRLWYVREEAEPGLSLRGIGRSPETVEKVTDPTSTVDFLVSVGNSTIRAT